MNELIASSSILTAFATIPVPYLWMLLIGGLLTMLDVRLTAIVLIVMSMIAILHNTPVEAAGYKKKPQRYGYGYAARGPFMPFQQGYTSRTKRMQQQQQAPHVMYNGGYVDTRSRFQPW